MHFQLLKTFKFLTTFLIIYSITNPAYTQRLELFTSASGIGSMNGLDKVPYPYVSALFDFIEENASPDTLIDNQPCYYVYFKVPYEVTEIGVRMISPVPSYYFAEAGNIVTTNFEAKPKSTKYFNPWIAVEKKVQDSLDVTKYIWEMLGKNEDSEEVIAQPDNRKTNSLIQLTGGPYAPGIYRVKFRGEINKLCHGSYLMQFGFLPEVKRVQISRDELFE